MNKYLKPIFEILLFGLEEGRIDYWVYGGIGVAAYAGVFIRDNQDIDIFVRNTDFESARSTLSDLCKKNNFKLYSDFQKGDGRPKVEIKVDGIERFSMIPAYQEGNKVIFKYKDGDQEYPNKILEKVERNISGNRFFTPRNEFLEDMFVNHINARPDKKKREKYKTDAKAILSPEKISSLSWNLE